MGNFDHASIVAQCAHTLSRLGVKSTSSILAATSGGADSMVLLFVLNQLREQGHIKTLEAIHINHSLRGKESDNETKLVQKFCRRLKISLHVFTVDTKAFATGKKLGIEEAARELRYEKIIQIARSKKNYFVATAHHANDQVETVLMNIVRGAGLKGLQGIPESRFLSKNTKLIRPFLAIDRESIRSFAHEHSVPFSEDSSNSSPDFQRNRVRQYVLPALERAFKGRDVYAGFSRMTRNVASVSTFVDDQVKLLREKARVEIPSIFTKRKMSSFDRKKLLAAPDFIRRELLLQEASLLSDKIVTIDQVHSLLLESYLGYPSKKPFQLSHDVLFLHDKFTINVEVIEPYPSEQHSVSLGQRIATPIGHIVAKKVTSWKKPIDANTAIFRFSDIGKAKLLLRYWRPGDKMKPFGMQGKSRLVSDILNDAGIKSERLKYFVPVIVFKDEPDHLIWIPGIRSAEFGRLTKPSETALQIKRTRE